MTILKGVNNEEGELYEILILGLHNHLFPYLSSTQVHWWCSLHTAVQRVPAHSESPQVQSQMDDMTTLWLHGEESPDESVFCHALGV